MLGTNDATVGRDPFEFGTAIETIVARLEAAGVVPILSTIPESLAMGEGVTRLARVYNQVIANIAAEQRLPLWNFFNQVAGIPSEGLGSDRLHLSVSPGGGGQFSPNDLAFGQNQHNLGALVELDWYRHAVVGAIPAVATPLPAWTSLAGHSVFAVGRDLGQAPIVSVYDAITHQELDHFLAFEPGFAGGVRVAVGDVNGDTVPDIVVGAGPGGGPVVAAFSGVDGSRLASFAAYEISFRGGVGSIAVKDLDGDGQAEIAVGAGNGGGPVIAIFSGGTFRERQRFLAYDASFRGGVNVALGEFEGIGPATIAGAGIGGGPHVELFAPGNPVPLRSFFVDAAGFLGGVVVVAGDLTGDGRDELVTARATGGSTVSIWNSRTDSILRTIAPRSPNPAAGVRLAFAAAGSTDELLVGNGTGTALELQAFTGVNASPIELPPSDPTRAYGIFVG
jgi:hypothetical protein